MTDKFSRKISYLRLSVTDRCNFRCGYCVPERGVSFRPREDLLSFEEIERLMRLFVTLGISRVRLTGGEPTVRANLPQLVYRLSRLTSPDGRSLEVVMTSNGQRLGDLAGPLARAGLTSVNISLDTLDQDKFRQLTRGGDLATTIAGIDRAIAAGLVVKLNVVAMKGVNDGELVDICRFAWQRKIIARFIEHMPISEGCLYSPDTQLVAAEIRSIIAAGVAEELVPRGAVAGTGPARYWEVAGDPTRRLGIIAAMSEHFCDLCDRLRLTAVGDLHACLTYDDATSLRDLIRAGGSDEELAAAIHQAVDSKRAGHKMCGAAAARHQPMIAIGG